MALLFATLLPSNISAQTPNSIPDIPYTTDATGSYRADLYQPPTPGPHPAIVAIHGGSWRSGHKTELRRLCTDLAADGYVCFSIDYDVHPHSFPSSWQESRAAIAFLHTHAVEYGIDPTRIAALGTSAGGQLAALLALAPEGPATGTLPGQQLAPGTDNLPVVAAVLFNGGYDPFVHNFLVRRYLGGTCEQIPNVCKDASPDVHVHPGAPPIFVGHGTHDHLIPYTQATTFINLLQAAHDPVTPFIAKGAGHSYWRSRHWYAANLAAAESFLTATIRAPSSP